MSKESTPAHFDNMTAEPDIPIALTSGTTAMFEMEPSVKRAIDHDEDPDKFMIITEKDIDLAREYRNRMMERLISEEIQLLDFEEMGTPRVYVYDDDEWKEALIYSCETSHLWLQVGHEVVEGRIELFLHEMLSGDLLAERVKRVQARQRLRNGFNFSNEQVTAKVSLGRIGRRISKSMPSLQEESIKELSQHIVQENLSEMEVKTICRTLVESASSASSASSHLSRDLRRLNTSEKITSATLDPETTRLANEEQKGKRLLRD
ncbi:hypothetical protein RhiirA5_409704 [Rhizophagus irregularis]|uniref:Uncharacterized protein n=1 Tax=Rhizophagus irregularis TaxID=588596 RepID=A0A2I1EI55_9GLOM|nr:hypothetical protein RhiirA5_409704 [Rhizophagus irregularis]PKC65872.1 hypothetical protein RhiirA1_460470 [Rhizophagus irregularis]PKY21811.1 hypothetical protein RhiirB3_435525 [Rhizophagus irregularis]